MFDTGLIILALVATVSWVIATILSLYNHVSIQFVYITFFLMILLGIAVALFASGDLPIIPPGMKL